MTSAKDNQDDWLDSVGKDPDIKSSGRVDPKSSRDEEDKASKNE
jgi:hypothetical protein